MENTSKIGTQNTTFTNRSSPAITPTTIDGKKFSIMTFLKIHNIKLSLASIKKREVQVKNIIDLP
jgi:hypothetical protein